MAENRCPMCSQPNPEDADVCVSCQARLKPLVAGSGPVETPPSPVEEPREPDPAGEAEGSDWLSRMREDATTPVSEYEAPSEDVSPDVTPDWLGRLRDTQTVQPEAPAEEAAPDWFSESSEPEGVQEDAGAEAGVVPDWLSRIRQRETGEASPLPEAPESEAKEWISRLGPRESEDLDAVEFSPPVGDEIPEATFEAGGETEQPGLDEPQLGIGEPAGLTPVIPDEQPSPEGDVFTPAFDDLQSSAETPSLESESAEVELPWLDTTPAQEEAVAAESVPDMERLGEGVSGQDIEFEWSDSEEDDEPAFIPGGEAEPGVLPEEGSFGWLEPGDPEIAPEGEVVASGVFTDESAFDRLEPGEPAVASSAPEIAPQDAGGVESEPPTTPQERIFGMDVGIDLDAIEAEVPPPPEPVEAPPSSALIIDQKQPPTDSSAVDLNLDDIDLPDWVADMRDAPSPPMGADVIDDAALAPATLPSWLEAMRPIDSFRSIVDMESSETQSVESAGPLAGLRGVLMAEPVVAMPRAATIGAAGLEVTQRQYAQADLLQRILIEEERDHPSIRPERASMPILRWVISFILVLTVALPSILPSVFLGALPPPKFVPQDIIPFYSVVENLPTESPALVVFDYPPGYNGELGTIAGVFLEHLVRRGIPVATLSTSPTGPSLAEALLSQYGENWVDYIHLGYLSGGSTAVQIFSAAPRNAVPKGFHIPDEYVEVQSVWQSELLRDIEHLSDFSMVAVITAGPENARTWAEQAPPMLEGKPLVMILSAGAEPLVRPYYESVDPQVQGILTGLPVAVAYEINIDGQTDAARMKWDAYGYGMLAVQLILFVGGLYGLGLGLLRMGLRRAKGEEDD